jgi:2,6-dihydroxypyridine 3-monooxygenase
MTGSSRSGLRVAVVGGSLGGLTCAVRLQRAGARVEVFERSRRPLEGRGAGIVLHPASVDAVRAEANSLSARATHFRYLDSDGAITHDSSCSFRFSSYSALYQALLRQFDANHYHLGSEVVGFEDEGDGVSVELADRRTAHFDLIVSADGIQSAARRKLLPGLESVYAGYVGWRGTVSERDITPATLAILADAICYCIVPNSHLLIYPIPGSDGSTALGGRLVNWVWYRNVEQGPELDEMLTDHAGMRHTVAIGSGSVRDDVVERLRRESTVELPPPVAELVSRSPEPFVQVILDIAPTQMGFGRVALIGDAAFAIRPHIAAGTAKAAEDATTLAAAVADSPAAEVADALERWQVGRIRTGQAALERSRDAGVRAQFENTWSDGDTIPFGLREDGDSELI